ncbi:MAG: FAD-dependent oxidoreductase, partial [Candidatus Izemoplasmatales bacterium]
MKTIIIGGVAAGMSAASKLRRLNPKMTITVYEMGEDLSYGGCGMPYFLGDVIKDENKLLARNKDDFEKQNIQVYLNHEVTHLDYKHQSIEIFDRENKKTIKDQFDYLVIATGTKANRTNIPGSKEVNPYVLNTLEDARKIKANMKDVKEVAIIGGGYIGLEIAENFAHLGIKVHIIERAKQLLIVYDTFVAQKAKEILEKEKIQIYLDEALESYQKDNQKTIIKTNKRTLSVDMVIEAIGVRPNTEFLKDSGIEMLKNGAII